MISIRRGRYEVAHEFPLISVPHESYHRGFHRSPITLTKVDLVPRRIVIFLSGAPSDSSLFLDMPLENRNSAINDRDVEVDPYTNAMMREEMGDNFLE